MIITVFRILTIEDSEDNEEEEVVEEEIEPVEEASIYFKQPTIDQDTWIQSKAYSYSVSGANNDLSRTETADENGAVTGNFDLF